MMPGYQHLMYQGASMVMCLLTRQGGEGGIRTLEAGYAYTISSRTH